MIRYTQEAVLPRLTSAIEEVRQENAEAAEKASKALGLRALRHLPVIPAPAPAPAPAIDDSVQAAV
jgi:hypothetical protein